MEQEDAAEQLCDLWSLISGAQASTWSGILVREHLDSVARLAVFQTCHDGSDTVLGAAERTTFHLEMDEDLAATRARVQAVKGALLTRGKLPTKLWLDISSLWLTAMAPGMLVGSTAWLQQLVLSLPAGEAQVVPACNLTAMAYACPNLQDLTILETPEALPSPQLLTKLQKLSIASSCPDNDSQERLEHMTKLAHTIRLYMRQLTTLSLYLCHGFQQDVCSTVLPLLLTPDSVGTHLSHLDVHTTLTDTLLGLLLQYTPALEQLSVRDMRLTSAAHSQVPVPWRELTTTYAMAVSSVALLPQTTGLRLILPRYVWCDSSDSNAAAAAGAGAAAGAVAVAVQRLAEVAVPRPEGAPHDTVHLYPHPDIQVADQPTALRAGLSLLRAVAKPSPDQSIHLQGWSMSAQLLSVLHQGLPHWPVLGLASCVWPPMLAIPYASLLRLLPDTFRRVRIDVNGLDTAQIESICLGAPVFQETPYSLSINCGPELAGVLRDRLQQMLVYPNVLITSFVRWV